MALSDAERKRAQRNRERRDRLAEQAAREVSAQLNAARRTRWARGESVPLDDTEARVKRALAYAHWRDEAFARGECDSPAVEYE